MRINHHVYIILVCVSHAAWSMDDFDYNRVMLALDARLHAHFDL